MQILDYRDRPLVSRTYAADDLSAVQSVLTFQEEIIVDLGANLATTAWVDGFLVPIARRFGSTLPIAIVSDSDVTRSHVIRVFGSRGLRARIARTREDALGGRFDVVPRNRAANESDS